MYRPKGCCCWKTPKKVGGRTQRSSGYQKVNEEGCVDRRGCPSGHPKKDMRTWNRKPRVTFRRLKNELWYLLVLSRDSLAQNLPSVSAVSITCLSINIPSGLLIHRPQQRPRVYCHHQVPVPMVQGGGSLRPL